MKVHKSGDVSLKNFLKDSWVENNTLHIPAKNVKDFFRGLEFDVVDPSGCLSQKDQQKLIDMLKRKKLNKQIALVP